MKWRQVPYLDTRVNARQFSKHRLLHPQPHNALLLSPSHLPGPLIKELLYLGLKPPTQISNEELFFRKTKSSSTEKRSAILDKTKSCSSEKRSPVLSKILRPVPHKNRVPEGGCSRLGTRCPWEPGDVLTIVETWFYNPRSSSLVEASWGRLSPLTVTVLIPNL